MPINTAPNSPFKGYYPNVNPFGISPRYNPSGLISYLHRNESKEVTTSAKAVDKEVANIEAEKGEILSSFNPLGVGFHDIKDTPFHRRANCRVDLLWSELEGNKVEFVDMSSELGGIGLIQV